MKVPSNADLSQVVRFLSLFSRHFFYYKGDPGLIFNAGYDEENDVFRRLDTSRIAWWLDFRILNSIPGEESFAGARGLVLWRARADAAQPLSGFANVNGWEARIIFTEFGELVIPGNGLEADGNGFLPFGRFVHYTDSVSSPTVAVTGILSNIFLDFSGVDDADEESYFIGQDHIADAFVVRRWVAGAFAYSAGTNLFISRNDGSTTTVGPAGMVQYAKANLPAANAYQGSVVMVTDDVGGYTVAFSDGSNWRRVQDRAVVS